MFRLWFWHILSIWTGPLLPAVFYASIRWDRLISLYAIFKYLAICILGYEPKSLRTASIKCKNNIAIHHNWKYCDFQNTFANFQRSPTEFPTFSWSVQVPFKLSLLLHVPCHYVTEGSIVCSLTAAPETFFSLSPTVSPWPSGIRRLLGSLVYVRARGPSSKPSQGAHWHGPTQPTTWA